MARLLKLTSTSQFTQIYKKGRNWSTDILVLRALPNRSDVSRFGFVVSKRVGKAVVRNRVKRLLRQNAMQVCVKSGWDVVFIARQSAAMADYYRVRSSVTRLMTEAGLTTPDCKAQPSGAGQL